MMEAKEKITLQDIADIAGVSRNTVSKILNGRYTGPEETRDRILKLMVDHNYKGLGQLGMTEEKKEIKTILLLSHGELANVSFFLPLVNEIQQNMESRGYILMFYGIGQEELDKQQIPRIIAEKRVDGIVCIEIFQRAFIEKMLLCEIPTVFLEFYYDLWAVEGKYDVVMMNNEYPVHILTAQLLNQGLSRIGFVGDFTHCRGFYERYLGYCGALRDFHLAAMPQYCINYADEEGYGVEGKLRRCLKAMPLMPEAFVAANDSIAINLMTILQEWGIQIPQEIQVISFDNIEEAAHIKPPLTTVNSNVRELVRNVVGCLLQRMSAPERPRNVVYVDSEIVYRQSMKRES